MIAYAIAVNIFIWWAGEISGYSQGMLFDSIIQII